MTPEDAGGVFVATQKIIAQKPNYALNGVAFSSTNYVSLQLSRFETGIIHFEVKREKQASI